MASQYKLISLSLSTYICTESLPDKIPETLSDVPVYFEFLNSIMENGSVTHSTDSRLKKNKFQFLCASLNIFRTIEKLASSDLITLIQSLADSQKIGNKTHAWIMFCMQTNNAYQELEGSGEKADFHYRIFDDRSSDAILNLLHAYPLPSSSPLSVRKDSESSLSSDSASSNGRDPEISLTNITLGRFLKNYWEASTLGHEINDRLMSELWNNTILCKNYSLEQLENGIKSFPIELSFLYDRASSTIIDFEIGNSDHTATRDLTASEKTGDTLIIHNHPRGTCISLEDIVQCIKKAAKEVRAVTARTTYRAEIVSKDLPFEAHKDLINHTYLLAANNDILDNSLEYEFGFNSLQKQECVLSYLEYKGLVRLHNTCTLATVTMLPADLK